MTAARREIDFRTLEELEADLTLLETRGCTHVGNWDLGQACDHLQKTITLSLMEDVPFKLPLLIRILGPLVIKKRLFKTRQMPEKKPAPPQLVPKEGSDATRSLKRLRSGIERIRKHEGSFPKHPFLGKLTNEEWVQFQLIHAAHHLSFQIPKPAGEAPAVAGDGGVTKD